MANTPTAEDLESDATWQAAWDALTDNERNAIIETQNANAEVAAEMRAERALSFGYCT